MENKSASTNIGLRLVAYLALLIATAFGLRAIMKTLMEGHIHESTTQLIPWGLWVCMYIFFLGLSAGSFLLSTLIYVFGVKRLEGAGPMALLQALGCLALGGMLILLDLGHPGRMYLVLASFNPTSVMAWMGIFYNLYILVVLFELYFALRPHFAQRILAGEGPVGLYRLLALGNLSLEPGAMARDAKWLKLLGIMGIPVAIVVHGGVGAIFAVAKARPYWFGGLFPIVFLVSALASGGALLTFLMATYSRLPSAEKFDLVQSLAHLAIGLLVFDLLLLTSEILTEFYGGIPTDVTAWRLTLFGPYWWVFWFVQIGVGAVVPIALVALPGTRGRTGALGFAGLLVVLGMVGARLSIVIPAQIPPVLPHLVGAYNHPRFASGYFPSANEWLVVVGVAALGVWAFLISIKLIPLEAAAPKPAAEGGASS